MGIAATSTHPWIFQENYTFMYFKYQQLVPWFSKKALGTNSVCKHSPSGLKTGFF